MIHKMMYTRYEATPGQVVPTGASWTVPDGVHVISLVCVGCALLRGATALVSSLTDTLVGAGGGLGGAPGSGGTPGSSGAGGHGGYSGNGGKGGRSAGAMGTSTYGEGGFPGAGGGGGGGGGAGQSDPYGSYPSGVSGAGGAGGGVGLNGLGTNGTGGNPGNGGDGYYTSGTPGSSGSALAGATIVAGNGFAGPGGGFNPLKGSNLAWDNNIAVTPGEVLTISKLTDDRNSGIRILWGGGRSYPSNAGNL